MSTLFNQDRRQDHYYACLGERPFPLDLYPHAYDDEDLIPCQDSEEQKIWMDCHFWTYERLSGKERHHESRPGFHRLVVVSLEQGEVPSVQPLWRPNFDAQPIREAL